MAKKKARKSAISATIKKRLKKLPGKSRRYIDTRTKKTYSRRQFDSSRKIKKRKNAKHISIEIKKYHTFVEIFISAKEKQGIFFTKRQAIQSSEVSQLWRDMHNSDTSIRAAAFDAVTEGDRDEWTPYIERWISGKL